MALPLFEELRFKNPCCRLRRIFDGWYWRFIVVHCAVGFSTSDRPEKLVENPLLVNGLRSALAAQPLPCEEIDPVDLAGGGSPPPVR